MANEMEENLKKANSDAEKLLSTEKKLLENRKRILENLSGLKKSQQEYGEATQKSIKKAKLETKEYEESLEGLDDALKKIPETINKDFNRSVNASGDAFEKAYGKKARDNIKKLQRALESGGGLSSEQLLSKKTQSEVMSRIKDINKAIHQVDNEALGSKWMKRGAAAKNIGGSLKRGWVNKDPSEWRSTGNMMKEWGNRQKALGQSMGSKPGAGIRGKLSGGAMRAGGKAANVAGGGMAAAGKAVPLVAAVVKAVSTINDAVNYANNKYTGAMRDYSSLAGAQTDGGAFVKESKEFNSAIRDLRSNMELGMDSSDWKSMFESMAQGGLSIRGVKEKMGDLDSTMEATRRTSLALGVSTEVMGEAMVQQNLELGTGISTMQEGYEEVAKSARSAGIESNKFLNVIQASTLSMGTYGNFTKAAASTLEKLSNNAGVTQKDAEEMTTGITTFFKGKDITERMKFTGMLGKGAEETVIAPALQKKLDDINEKLSSGNVTGEERRKLKGQRTKISDALNTQGGERYGALASATRYVDALPLILKALKNVKGNNSQPMEEYLGSYGGLVSAQALGISEDMVEQLKNSLQGDIGQLDPVMGSLNDYLQKLVTGGESTKDLKEGFRQLMANLSKGRDMTKAESDASRNQISSILEKQGVSPENIEDFIYMLEKDSKTLGETYTGLLKKNEDLFSKGKGLVGASSSEVAVKQLERTADSSSGLYKDTVKNQKAQIKALTPIEKMTGMARDSLEWQVFSSNTAEASYAASLAIKKGVFGILDYMTRSERGDFDAAVANLKEYTSKYEESNRDVGAVKNVGTAKARMALATSDADKEEILSKTTEEVARLMALKEGTSVGEQQDRISLGSGGVEDRFKKLMDKYASDLNLTRLGNQAEKNLYGSKRGVGKAYTQAAKEMDDLDPEQRVAAFRERGKELIDSEKYLKNKAFTMYEASGKAAEGANIGEHLTTSGGGKQYRVVNNMAVTFNNSNNVKGDLEQSAYVAKQQGER